MDLAGLPEVMLTEILVRLDINSLIRSSCVCKAWRFLILETPHFGDKHLNHWNHLKNDDDDMTVFLRYPSGNNELLTFNYSQSPPFLFKDLEFPFQSTNQSLLVRQCNGILCISECAKFGSVHLCNVTTLEHLVLPPGLFEDDAVYATENLGFGFDQSTNDYKVIRIKRIRIRRTKRTQRKDIQVAEAKKRVEVYSVGTNSWSELNVNLPLQDRICGAGVFLNGFCHWWDRAKTPSPRMITFDFKGEKFGEMSFPMFVPNAWGADIDVVGDTLAVCSWRMDQIFEVWTMGEYGKHESWSKKFGIISPLFGRDTYWFHDSYRMVFGYPKHLMVCPLEKKDRSAQTRFFEFDCSYLTGTSSTVFRPSLVSLRNRLPATRS